MENISKKILIIEDEPSLFDSLNLEIGKIEGIKIFSAKDGEVGLKLSLKEKPDLILLDIVMPKLDGMEMLRRLRMDDWGKNALVIILTNLFDLNTEREASKMGVKEYIIKADWRVEDIAKLAKKELGLA